MDTALPTVRLLSPAQWRDLVLPREHGSWSLALEPVALGLLAAPSVPGGWFGLAVAAGFFARRPLRTAWREAKPQRRCDAAVALLACSVVAAAALVLAIAAAGTEWLAWLMPSAIAGAVFVAFDLRNDGRSSVAEVAGASAFALLPGAFARLGGADTLSCAALALVMLGRAVPTVLTVRTMLRAAKGGDARPTLPLVVALVAAASGVGLWRQGLAPAAAALALTVLAARSVIFLGYPRPVLRARTIGMIEAVLGLAFVVVVGATWNF